MKRKDYVEGKMKKQILDNCPEHFLPELKSYVSTMEDSIYRICVLLKCGTDHIDEAKRLSDDLLKKIY